MAVSYFFIFFLPVLSVFIAKNNSFVSKGSFSGLFLEFGWTLLPATILLSLLAPSFTFLYTSESSTLAGLLVKVVGNQWYWNYFFSDLGLELGSFLKDSGDLEKGQSQLLTCSSPCVVPYGVALQWLITSNDVLHSWNLPPLAIKTDAIPGFITVVSALIQYPGFYFGMCSELCGNYHTFMAINVEAVSPKIFSLWSILSL